jgi:transporter family-2 protein
MIWIFLTLALVIGVLLPVQAGLNAQMRLLLPHPIVAALVSFLVGSVTLAGVTLFLRIHWVSHSRLASAPWWVWTGGIFGANYVLVALILAPRLGAATLIGLSVTGQMISSVVLDHFGLVGYPVHPVTAGRIVGAALLLIGTLLIQRF